LIHKQAGVVKFMMNVMRNTLLNGKPSVDQPFYPVHITKNIHMIALLAMRSNARQITVLASNSFAIVTSTH